MGDTMTEAKTQLHKLDGFTSYLEKNGGKDRQDVWTRPPMTSTAYSRT